MIFDSIFSTPITLVQFLIATCSSMVIGFFVAFFYMFKNERKTKSMSVSLVLLPGIVTVAMMLVNGNLGTGLAVAGVFNLVRFRSIKASAKDLSCIFSSMVVGLCCGVGYVAIAALFVFIVALFGTVLQMSKFGESSGLHKTLKITLPESLNYEGMFDDILREHVRKYKEVCVKTVAMGSLFRIEYAVEMKSGVSSKDMIDKIRERNGNLEVSLSTIANEEED